MGQKTLHLVSLGCTKNLVDSEVMLGKLSQYKVVDDPNNADVIIVNTCGFIEAAKTESLETIMELHALRKRDSLLVMSGCLSERYKEELQQDLSEVDIFTGVGDYDNIDKLIEAKKSSYSPSVFLANEDVPRVITGSSYHAYIKIAEGCNQSCSFCAIPNFKGKLHSRGIDSIVKEVKSLVARGYWDFSFISQDSSSYGRDLGLKDGLVELIKAVEKIEGVQSAKILYLYPSTTTFALIDAIADSPLFQTYYDIPIQHSDDEMLKTMKRGFGETKTKELLAYMHSKPNAFIRSTFIVGHPGEDDEIHFLRTDSSLLEGIAQVLAPGIAITTGAELNNPDNPTEQTGETPFLDGRQSKVMSTEDVPLSREALPTPPPRPLPLVPETTSTAASPARESPPDAPPARGPGLHPRWPPPESAWRPVRLPSRGPPQRPAPEWTPRPWWP